MGGNMKKILLVLVMLMVMANAFGVNKYVAEKKIRIDVGGHEKIEYNITTIDTKQRADTGKNIEVKGAVKKGWTPARIVSENTHLQNQIDALQLQIDNNNAMSDAIDKVK